MGDDQLSEELYTWVNELELSKPKKNFSRDFSDGVIVAEILKKEYPRLVELHNYAPANSFSNKMKNWGWLNDKVLRKIGLGQNYAFFREVASSKRSAVEKLLLTVKKKLDDIKEEKRKKEFSVEEEITEEGIMVVDIRLQSTVPYEDFRIIQEDLSKKEEELQTLHAKQQMLHEVHMEFVSLGRISAETLHERCNQLGVPREYLQPHQTDYGISGVKNLI